MPRHAAWNVLRSGTTTPMRAVDREAERRGLEPRDRALLRRILGTEVRRRGTLRAILRTFANGKLSQDIAAHLRLGLAQLFFLDRVPPHAAVSETVRATSDTIGHTGLHNRAVTKIPPELDISQALGTSK